MKRHESQRGYFAYELHQQMKQNKDIYLVTADLGYKLFDAIRDDYPDRFFNLGASEQAMVGIAVGMTYRGKIPIVYSITNFVLFRPFEWIRNYIDHEKAPVILVGAGRDMDYKEDGWTHQSPDAKKALACFPNVRQYWPQTKQDGAEALKQAIESKQPSFISLIRK